MSGSARGGLAMVRFPFMPKEEKFFGLFEQSAQNIVKAAEVLREMVDTWQLVESRVAEITELEHAGDMITHQIMLVLGDQLAYMALT